MYKKVLEQDRILGMNGSRNINRVESKSRNSSICRSRRRETK
jgi:hypothetical protein